MKYKKCNTCEKEVVESFFYKDQCVPCAADKGVTAKAVASQDYEEIEDVGCAGWACTL